MTVCSTLCPIDKHTHCDVNADCFSCVFVNRNYPCRGTTYHAAAAAAVVAVVAVAVAVVVAVAQRCSTGSVLRCQS